MKNSSLCTWLVGTTLIMLGCGGGDSNTSAGSVGAGGSGAGGSTSVGPGTGGMGGSGTGGAGTGGTGTAGGGGQGGMACVPSTEVCDGMDNNCDGIVDEGCDCIDGDTQACYSGDPSTQGVGECMDGTQTCVNGSWDTCQGDVVPVNETCDGLDNDCDGQSDEDLGMVMCGIGECLNMVEACTNGQPNVCMPNPPGMEACDGLDNNCDGTVDDGDPGGGMMCDTGNLGICAAGTTACTGGTIVCNQDMMPTNETCDGLDNNCDGTVDDGDPGGGLMCSTGLPGVCDPGTTACSNGSVVCNQNVQPSPEMCDGLDNDCNGSADDGNPGGGMMCNTGNPGVCAAGTTACTNGMIACNQNVQPSPEMCDGLDNNCDGTPDEGNPGSGMMCNTGLPGICGPGTTNCTGGMLACMQNVPAGTEVCGDTLDNDCDGLVNETCCTNIAPQATPTTSGGGSEPNYGPVRLNNGVGQVCNEWSWISNGQTPSGAYFQYTWSSPQTIGSFYVDGEHATSPACGTTGRDIKSATVQWWNGSSWVTAGTIANQENYMYTFPTPVTTSRIRLYDVITSPGNGNSIIFEWYVYPGTGCSTPP